MKYCKRRKSQAFKEYFGPYFLPLNKRFSPRAVQDLRVIELLIGPLPAVPGEWSWCGRPLHGRVEAGGEVAPVQIEVGTRRGGSVRQSCSA